MRTLTTSLLLLSILLAGARLFTGVVYGVDSPMAYFVLKSAPDLRMERPEAEGQPISREIILDAEEPQLSYGWLYFAVMRAAPLMVVVMLAACGLMMRGARGRQRGPLI